MYENLFNVQIKAVYFACIVTECGKVVFCSPMQAVEIEAGYVYDLFTVDGFLTRYCAVLKVDSGIHGVNSSPLD